MSTIDVQTFEAMLRSGVDPENLIVDDYCRPITNPSRSGSWSLRTVTPRSEFL